MGKFKKRLQEGAAPQSAAATLLEDPPKPQPRPEALGPEKIKPGSVQMPRDSMAGITQRLGARWWANNKRFEWAIATNGHHYEFTRYYFEQLVIVDVWPNSHSSARTESEKKRACVDAENARRVGSGQRPIGLIAIVRGTMIDEEYFNAALRGETMALVEPSSVGVLT